MPCRKQMTMRRPPSRGTLTKYGLTADDWLEMCRLQQYICPVCQQPFGDRRLVIDHEHVRGFRAHKTVKAKKGKRRIKVRVMSPEQRRSHVRGILHSYCNRMVRRWLTIKLASAVLQYLQAHERRKS